MANNPQFRIGIGSREICFVFSRISQTSSGHRPPLFTSKFVCFGLHSATSFRPDQLCHLANASVAYAYFVWVSTACVLANSILVGWFLIFHRPLLPHRYILIPKSRIWFLTLMAIMARSIVLCVFESLLSSQLVLIPRHFLEDTSDSSLWVYRVLWG